MTASPPGSSWPRCSPPASGPCRSTAMSTAGDGGATEVHDAILLSVRARHACVCVPVAFWHVGQLIEAPNFITIASAMYILAPAGCGWCVRKACPVIVWLGWFLPLAVPLQLQLLQPLEQPLVRESPNTASRLKAPGGEVRPTGLMSQGRPATSRITSRLHLLLSGSRRTALILLAPRWSRPMCSSLPSTFPAHTTSTKRWSSLPSLSQSLRTPKSLLRTCAA